MTRIYFCLSTWCGVPGNIQQPVSDMEEALEGVDGSFKSSHIGNNLVILPFLCRSKSSHILERFLDRHRDPWRY